MTSPHNRVDWYEGKPTTDPSPPDPRDAAPGGQAPCA